jgi:hypothetical protein
MPVRPDSGDSATAGIRAAIISETKLPPVWSLFAA